MTEYGHVVISFYFFIAPKVNICGNLFLGLTRGFHRLGCQPLDHQLLNHYTAGQENSAAD
jgi:hypothetical protein